MAKAEAEPITVLIVDDHPVVRLGLKSALARSKGLRVVGEAGTIAEAHKEVARHRPDVLLMDVRLPDGNGVIACRDIRENYPDTQVLFLTSYPDQAAVVGAVFGGAAGYLLKDVGREELIESVKRVARGQAILAPSVTKQILHHMRQAGEGGDVFGKLSAQELKVIAQKG